MVVITYDEYWQFRFDNGKAYTWYAEEDFTLPEAVAKYRETHEETTFVVRQPKGWEPNRKRWVARP